MDEQALTVPKGKDLLVVQATGHTWLSLRDGRGHERTRIASKGKHLTLAVAPGAYVLATDGKIKAVALERLENPPASFDVRKPPRPQTPRRSIRQRT
ncbi:MAG TPA: hypothetical protein VKA21_13695 [Candidatus Binatia bacterium]|nr:hypothetical protein [Candidatus Binatia bacterium]